LRVHIDTLLTKEGEVISPVRHRQAVLLEHVFQPQREPAPSAGNDDGNPEVTTTLGYVSSDCFK